MCTNAGTRFPGMPRHCDVQSVAESVPIRDADLGPVIGVPLGALAPVTGQSSVLADRPSQHREHKELQTLLCDIHSHIHIKSKSAKRKTPRFLRRKLAASKYLGGRHVLWHCSCDAHIDLRTSWLIHGVR